MAAIAAGVFLGAFLLFQVQPLLAKYILPWFGGSPSVWTTAMLFFQSFLLGGYAYAHWLTTHLPIRRQVGLHLVLILGAVLLLPIIPSAGLRPTGTDAPTVRILVVLLITVGLQYLLLASTSPLLQAWSLRVRQGRSPYRLYALSNVASLLALMTYPFLIEPWLGRELQAWAWSIGFIGFGAIICSVCMIVWRREAGDQNDPSPGTSSDTQPVSRHQRVLWFAWAATGSVLLLSITNQITQDVAVVPFFWVLPLSLYLLTFVIAFERDTWYRRDLAMGTMVPAIGAMVWMLYRAGTAPVLWLITSFMVGLFICCMVCHGELARLKPSPARLTEFYLAIAAGGALGGVFSAVVAPLTFSVFLELHIGVLVCAALSLATLARDRRSRIYGLRPVGVWLVLAVGYVALSSALTRHVQLTQNAVIAKSRNFYGVLTVLRLHVGTDTEHLAMRNGMIDHGAQLLAADKRSLPTTYYGHNSGLGIAFRSYPRTPRKVGVVGLGVGTVAAYTRPGDTLRMYEINPTVTQMANEFFTYLRDAQGELHVVHGDGRRSLELEDSHRFDILVLDAFSGDAIPVHLLTREAFAIYTRHLVRDGVLIVNVSNRHVDIAPVVRQHAIELGLRDVRVTNGTGPNIVWHAEWMLLTNNRDVLGELERHISPVDGPSNEVRPWTDDYANLLAVLR